MYKFKKPAGLLRNNWVEWHFYVSLDHSASTLFIWAIERTGNEEQEA